MRQPLQRAVSCVSPAVLNVTGARGGGPVALTLPAGDAVRLRGHDVLTLSVGHWCMIAPAAEAPRQWLASTVGYAYALLDPDGHELIAYHWHPTGSSPVTFPHLHVDGRSVALDRKIHLPTGLVALAAVVRCAITELGVRPLRSDWRTILEVPGS